VTPSCVLSPCERYRYELRIPLRTAGGVCLFLMANPSTAVVVDGRFVSDPTITRCIRYAQAWGYGTLVVGNVRAWRETNPKRVPADPEAVGPENDVHLLRLMREADVIVAGWGKLGGGQRAYEVLQLFDAAQKPMHALRLNKDASPAHPLYLPAALTPVLVRPPRGLGEASHAGVTDV
jgi:hypothetical protein